MNNTSVRPAASVANFERLQQDPLFEDMAGLIAEVLSYAFDNPAAVEIDQWTLSCLPSTNKSAERFRLFTLNVGPMEILSVECHLLKGAPIEHVMYLYVSSSALERQTDCRIEELDQKFDLLSIERTGLSSADGDGTVIACSLEDSAALEQYAVLPFGETTVRPLVQHLIAKGKGPFRQYHNAGFAEYVLERLVSGGS